LKYRVTEALCYDDSDCGIVKEKDHKTGRCCGVSKVGEGDDAKENPRACMLRTMNG